MGENNAVPGTTMARTIEDIWHSYRKAERMNCRDIADLFEAIVFMRKRLREIERECSPAREDFGNSTVVRLAQEALRVSKCLV